MAESLGHEHGLQILPKTKPASNVSEEQRAFPKAEMDYLWHVFEQFSEPADPSCGSLSADASGHPLHRQYPQSVGRFMTKKRFMEFMNAEGPADDAESSVCLPDVEQDFFLENIFRSFANHPQHRGSLDWVDWIGIHRLFYNDDTQREMIYWLFSVTLTDAPRVLRRHVRKSVWYNLRSVGHIFTIGAPVRRLAGQVPPNAVPLLDFVDLMFHQSRQGTKRSGALYPSAIEEEKEEDTSSGVRSLRRAFSRFLRLLVPAFQFWHRHKDMLSGVFASLKHANNDDSDADDTGASPAVGSSSQHFLNLATASRKSLAAKFLEVAEEKDRMNTAELVEMAQQFGMYSVKLCERVIQLHATKRHGDTISFQDLLDVILVLQPSASFRKRLAFLFQLADVEVAGEITLGMADSLLEELTACGTDAGPHAVPLIDLSLDDARLVLQSVFLQAARNKADDASLVSVESVTELRVSLDDIETAIEQWELWCELMTGLSNLLGPDVGSVDWLDVVMMKELAAKATGKESTSSPGVSNTPSSNSDEKTAPPSCASNASGAGASDDADDAENTNGDDEDDAEDTDDDEDDDHDFDNDEEEEEIDRGSLLHLKEAAAATASRSMRRRKARPSPLQRTTSLRALETSQQFRWSFSNLCMVAVILCFPLAAFFATVTPAAVGLSMVEEWGMSSSTIGLLSSSLTMGYVASLLLIPFAHKTLGVRKLMFVLCALIATSMLVGQIAISSKSPMLIVVANLLLGLGDLYLPVSILISSFVPVAQFTLVFGLANSLYMVSGFAASVIVPYLVDTYGLETALWVSNYQNTLSIASAMTYLLFWGRHSSHEREATSIQSYNRFLANIPAIWHKHPGIVTFRCSLRRWAFPWRTQAVIAYGFLNGVFIYCSFTFVPAWLTEEWGWPLSRGFLAVSGIASLSGVVLVPTVAYVLNTYGRRFQIACATNAALLLSFLLLSTRWQAAPWILGIVLGLQFSVLRSIGIPVVNICTERSRVSDASSVWLFVWAIGIVSGLNGGGLLYTNFGYSGFAGLVVLCIGLGIAIMFVSYVVDVRNGGLINNPLPAGSQVSLRYLPKARYVLRREHADIEALRLEMTMWDSLREDDGATRRRPDRLSISSPVTPDSARALLASAPTTPNNKSRVDHMPRHRVSRLVVTKSRRAPRARV